MKLSLISFGSLGVVASLLVACASATPSPSARPPVKSLELESQTVALYTQDGEAPRCTAVWVDDHKILTAAHCISDDAEDPIFYATRTEYQGAFRKPTLHSMALLKADEKADLALYETGAFDTPAHVTAVLASSTPAVGAPLHFMGHSAGLAWSYKHGYVAFYREADFRPVEGKTGPWLQVSAPIFHGDSGGGAFNEYGELVGIASFMASRVPLACFFVERGTIAKFVGAK